MWCVLNPMPSALIRDRREDIEEKAIWRWGRDWSDRVVSQGTPGTTRGWKTQRTESPQSLRRKLALWTPWFRASALQNCDRIHSCCFLSCPICGNLLQKQWKTNTNSRAVNLREKGKKGKQVHWPSKRSFCLNVVSMHLLYPPKGTPADNRLSTMLQ